MEVKNGYFWKVFAIGDSPIFHFHNCGRKGCTLPETNSLQNENGCFLYDYFPFWDVAYFQQGSD